MHSYFPVWFLYHTSLSFFINYFVKNGHLDSWTKFAYFCYKYSLLETNIGGNLKMHIKLKEKKKFADYIFLFIYLSPFCLFIPKTQKSVVCVCVCVCARARARVLCFQISITVFVPSIRISKQYRPSSNVTERGVESRSVVLKYSHVLGRTETFSF